VLPFDRKVIDHPDFCQQFNVHTRWIETDFKAELEPAKRQLPQQEDILTHTFIEIDGKRCKLGLPAKLFSGLSISQTNSEAQSVVTTNTNLDLIVPAPVSGNLFKWLVEDNQKVEQGDMIAIIEAMKMEIQVIAHREGILKHSHTEGTYVNADDPIAEII